MGLVFLFFCGCSHLFLIDIRLPPGAAEDSLLKGMENLTMVDKAQLAASTLREDVMLESDFQFEGIGGPARPSLDHHATCSSSDLMHHMHGATPIRPRQQGKPPRLSLQSVTSNVSMASPFPVTSFLGDFASTYVLVGTTRCVWILPD